MLLARRTASEDVTEPLAVEATLGLVPYANVACRSFRDSPRLAPQGMAVPHRGITKGPAPAGSSNPSGEGDPALRDRALIEADLVDPMVARPGQFFDSTQIPVRLWLTGEDSTLDSANDARSFDGETELSPVA